MVVKHLSRTVLRGNGYSLFKNVHLKIASFKMELKNYVSFSCNSAFLVQDKVVYYKIMTI